MSGKGSGNKNNKNRNPKTTGGKKKVGGGARRGGSGSRGNRNGRGGKRGSGGRGGANNRNRGGKNGQAPAQWVQFVMESRTNRGVRSSKSFVREMDDWEKDLVGLQAAVDSETTYDKESKVSDLLTGIEKSGRDLEKSVTLAKRVMGIHRQMLTVNGKLEAENRTLLKQVNTQNELCEEYALAQKKSNALIKTYEDIIKGLQEENQALRNAK
eukprot:TRINITY_DN10596_c0_g1_i1.p1 TRINITY_DN10596_c0_g1~~TRINITY_DN10596_c0_g1_i1.p1  ORF type:complete len:212 (-),score=47.64 TRINITY_DN10596_c0_g1_i1:82-717(-)